MMFTNILFITLSGIVYIVYIVGIIICLLILYVGTGLSNIKGNNSYKLLLPIYILSHLWQCEYEIDYGSVCSYKVL